MKHKRTIYGIILIIICMLELFNPFGGSILFHLLDEYNYGKIYVLLLGVLFAIPLVVFLVSLIWQIKSEKALHCLKKIIFFALLSQLYVVTFSNYNIILSISFLMLSIAFQTESIFLEEVCLTRQSFYRKRVLILVCIIALTGIIAVPFIKYEYYERSPYYYRVDEEGYTPASYLTNYMIYGTGILQQVDSYYRCDYWGNYKIGWVFKAKKSGHVTLTVQQYYKWGDIRKKIYTIHVDQDKKIEVTGMREIRIEEKY